MTFTYKINSPGDADRVRFLLGDTDSDDVMLQDEEIATLLTENPNIHRAAAAGADALAARWLRASSVTGLDGLSLDYKAKADGFVELAGRLRRLAAAGTDGGLGEPIVGGVSNQEIADNDADTDRPGSFRVGMHENNT